MPVDPPKIDREAQLRKEAAARRVELLLHQVLPLLREHEGLDTPYREGDLIVVPIVQEGMQAEDDGGSDGPSSQAFSGSGVDA